MLVRHLYCSIHFPVMNNKLDLIEAVIRPNNAVFGHFSAQKLLYIRPSITFLARLLLFAVLNIISFILGTLVAHAEVSTKSSLHNSFETNLAKQKADEKNLKEKLMSVGSPKPPLPVYNGPYCDTDDLSLKNTYEPSDSLEIRSLCAINGKDWVQRFAQRPAFDKTSILKDYKGRVSVHFSIPDSIHQRVAFWFDIYTRYPSYVRIVHHAKYPWIKFREFDLTDFLVSPQIEWMKVQKAEKHIRTESDAIRARLVRLSKKSNFDHLNSEDQKLFDLLKEVPGSRSKVFREAAEGMRVQTGQMDFFVEAILRKSQYLEAMEKIFAEQGVPTDLTRLPLVESSFNPQAISKAGASGIWQFMPGTGKSLMKVTDDIDERRSPLKSTVGAAKYLRGNMRELGRSWPLAVLAYNHGPGGVRKALRSQKTTDIAVLINSYSGGSFGFASANYYPEFLAALYAEKYQNEVFGKLTTLPKIKTEELRLPRAVTPHDLARTLALPLDVIAGYNLDIVPSIGRNRSIPVGYVLHVPQGFAKELNKNLTEQLPVKTIAKPAVHKRSRKISETPKRANTRSS